jgi:membrane protein YdbS with pleckstrin-like domain
MTNKAKQTSDYVYSKAQHTTLIVCTLIMVAYIILAYFVTLGSFWTFAGVHIVLAAIAIFFLWFGKRI